MKLLDFSVENRKIKLGHYTHLANVDPELSRECAEAYRSLPDPEQGPIELDSSRVHRTNIQRTVDAYKGQSRYLQPKTIFDRLQQPQE